MKLFPAIDMMDGKAVRLLYGDKDKVTIYGTPVEMAKQWADCGATYLHLVDLDGAFTGTSSNLKFVKDIVKQVGIKCQLGGGIRTLDDIKERIEETQVDRVIIGTAAYKNIDMVEKAVSLYGDKIACGIDVKNDYVAIKGWVEKVDELGIDFAKRLEQIGVKTVIFTDISRDGALTGVNVKSTVEMQKSTTINIIASGGVTSMNDLIELNKNDCYGCILGRAIYNGNIDVKEAIELIQKEH